MDTRRTGTDVTEVPDRLAIRELAQAYGDAVTQRIGKLRGSLWTTQSESMSPDLTIALSPKLAR